MRSASRKSTLQQKIQAAVSAAKGWEGLPPKRSGSRRTRRGSAACSRSIRRKAMEKVKQPMLIVQGDLDSAGAAAPCRQARRTGPGAEEERRSSRSCTSRHQSPARSRHDRRGAGIPRSCQDKQISARALPPPSPSGCAADVGPPAPDRLDFMPMKIGIPKETWPGETRVAVVPAGVGRAHEGRPRRWSSSRRPASRPAFRTRPTARRARRSVEPRPRSSQGSDILLRSAPSRPTPALRSGQAVIGFADPLGAPAGHPRRRGHAARRCCRWN